MTEAIQKEMVQLVGQFVDLALKPARSGELMGRGFRCVYCDAFAATPPEIRHKVGCVVAHGQRLLQVVAKD